MKKIILCLLILCSFLILSSCENEDNGPKYNVELVNAQFFLYNKLKSSYSAGETITLQVSIVTDASVYVYLNDERLISNKAEGHFTIYEFVMPEKDITLVFTTDQFYGRDELEFSEVYWFTSRIKEGTQEIMVLEEPASPNELIVVKRSNDPSDVENMVGITNQKLKRAKDCNFQSQPTNRIYFEKTLNGKKESYEVEIIGKYVYYYDFSSAYVFEFLDDTYEVPVVSNPYQTTYKFKYNGLSSDVKRISDDAIMQHYYNINSIEFILYNGTIIADEPNYYLDSNYGRIELISQDIFKWNDKYYKIVANSEYWPYNYYSLNK